MGPLLLANWTNNNTGIKIQFNQQQPLHCTYFLCVNKWWTWELSLSWNIQVHCWSNTQCKLSHKSRTCCYTITDTLPYVKGHVIVTVLYLTDLISSRHTTALTVLYLTDPISSRHYHTHCTVLDWPYHQQTHYRTHCTVLDWPYLQQTHYRTHCTVLDWPYLQQTHYRSHYTRNSNNLTHCLPSKRTAMVFK